MKVHILDDWYDHIRALPCFERLDGHEVTVWNERAASEAELAERLSDAEAVVLFRDRTAITGSLATALPNLQLVAMRGQHTHVDVPAMSENGVLFCSNMMKDGPSVSTAELTFALILSAVRYLPEQIASTRAGAWQADAPLGRTLKGRRLGIYGYGAIGRAVAGYARAFGMEVTWWASEDSRARATEAGETVAESREAFFSGSYVVSLHKRLLPETRGEITESDLLSMSPDAVLVNTSRAGLIAPGAVAAALEAGRPGRFALDGFDSEPLTDPADPVLSNPRVIPTPHVGFVTQEELNRQFSDIFDIVNAFADGKPIDAIYPEVSPASRR